MAGSEGLWLAGATAFATLNRHSRFLFFFIPLTGQQLLIGLPVLQVLSFLFNKDLLALTASLAAIGAGLGYVRYMTRRPRPPRSKRSSGPRFRVVRGGGGSGSGESDRPKWLN
jgi:hypothetical protein